MILVTKIRLTSPFIPCIINCIHHEVNATNQRKRDIMNKYNAIFQPAEILVPSYTADPDKMSKWSVIACDQYTSELSYWKKCEKYIDGAPSSYDYILPEAYLGTPLEKAHGDEIEKNMRSFDKSQMREIDGMIYLERTLSDGTVRHGLVGKIDLEAYDYSPDSKYPVRATEATVLERIPPRCRVRASAEIELPHILILIDDNHLIADLAATKAAYPITYDFDLMGGGGHVTGYEITGSALDTLMLRISAYESAHSGVVYAMGDGNHSLAAAKAHWENVKRSTGGDMSHPARYALCEVTALSDDSLVFHPIYRILKNCNPAEVMAELKKIAEITLLGQDSVGIISQEQAVLAVDRDSTYACTFKKTTHALTVGTLQNFIDDYIKLHPETGCDYIHGKDTVRRLVQNDGCIGFIMNGMDKGELFPYVAAHGTLPRKTFSMGEADSKRYYLEARKITK